MDKMSKVVVLLSGGMDSTTVLYYAISEGHDVVPLFVDYGQKSLGQEHYTAQRICDELGLTLHWINIFGLYDDVETDYIPFRNPVLVMLAAGYAEKIGAIEVWTGIQSEYCPYPDCTIQSVACMEVILLRCGKRVLKLRNPLLRKNKQEIVELGRKLGVPYELTWSCYESGPEPCGKCDSCKKRMEVLN